MNKSLQPSSKCFLIFHQQKLQFPMMIATHLWPIRNPQPTGWHLRRKPVSIHRRRMRMQMVKFKSEFPFCFIHCHHPYLSCCCYYTIIPAPPTGFCYCPQLSGERIKSNNSEYDPWRGFGMKIKVLIHRWTIFRSGHSRLATGTDSNCGDTPRCIVGNSFVVSMDRQKPDQPSN